MRKIVLLLVAQSIILTALAQKSISLFNGRDLEGWTIHGTEKWYVENGHLKCVKRQACKKATRFISKKTARAVRNRRLSHLCGLRVFDPDLEAGMINQCYQSFFSFILRQRTLIPPPSWICKAIKPLPSPIF